MFYNNNNNNNLPNSFTMLGLMIKIKIFQRVTGNIGL